MLNRTRIHRLYWKDLLDILRDRRTLAAMIIVPIVLYPLLMLGSFQALTLQTDQMKEQPVVIGVQTQHIKDWLENILKSDGEYVEHLRQAAKDKAEPETRLDPIVNFRIDRVENQNLESWVREGRGQCAVMFDVADMPIPVRWDNRQVWRPKIIKDSAEIRSDMAAGRLRDVLDRRAQQIEDDRVVREGLPSAFNHPFDISEIDVASAQKRGGSMLGQIVPLILILITVTGTIYPAIDLTAGERERGTLETLLVCPVPVFEIIIGKFLVVTTVSLVGAALNLTSMGLMLQFGGFSRLLTSGAETQIPLHVLPMILLCLIPLAIFFSALMLAVCSFARTFKEAQNYMMPVVLMVLVPAGVAALPGSQLGGSTLVMPIANMVLLTREMLLGNAGWSTVLVVVLSTCLYAATAVALAVKVFDQEAIVFADAGGWRAQFDRHHMQPRPTPSATLSLIYVALLFPIWFYVQTAIGVDLSPDRLLLIQIVMILLFGIMPGLLVVYYKVNWVGAFSFRWPHVRYLAAALLMGCGTWVLVHELTVLQHTMSWFGMTDEFLKALQPQSEKLASLGPVTALLLLAFIPAGCEEMLFRGLLQSGLQRSLGRVMTIFATAMIFAVFHFMIQRFVVTFLLGLLLSYVCWQSRSIFPAMLIHLMHNGLTFMTSWKSFQEPFCRVLQIPAADDSLKNLPLHVSIPAMVLIVGGLLLCSGKNRAEADSSSA